MPTDGEPRGPALHDAKRALRQQVLAARDALPPEMRAAASLRICTAIVATPSFAAARTVLLTLPFRSEWDTLTVVRAALAAGKRVLVPRVDPAARMLTLHAIADPARDVAPGHQGIPEPLARIDAVAPSEVDWVLVPGVAFDGEGRRIGYGGGYYDRLLPLVPGGAARIAGAFDLQVVERVPAGPQDATVDVVATESRALVTRAPR